MPSRRIVRDVNEDARDIAHALGKTRIPQPSETSSCSCLVLSDSTLRHRRQGIRCVVACLERCISCRAVVFRNLKVQDGRAQALPVRIKRE